VRTTHLPGLPVRRGKVRDVYDLGEQLLIVATDRISAFDCVLPNPIPLKGRVLTMLSKFWFEQTADVCPHHLIAVVENTAPPRLEEWSDQIVGRAMLCRKAKVVPIECVARGYLAGSGWKEYAEGGTVCGIRLPAGLRQGSPLPAPVFTPSTKAEQGHDENVSFERACDIVGGEVMLELRAMTLRLYAHAAEYARQRGIIIADTKFEFGFVDGRLILVDEVLTPDSSRFWPADGYREGQDQPSFDKQFVRDYLQRLCDEGRWNKSDPAPTLPEELVAATSARYLEAYQRIVGRPLPTQP
jgi:phosphoribosylaminoimidazole-succinocarboxamide synthase